MDCVDLEVLRTARAWTAARRTVTLATVTRTWGSAPRRAGAMLAVRDDGQVVGSVSGGCVEDDLIEQARDVWCPLHPRVVAYGVTREHARRFGLPCGGTLQVVLEPVAEAGWIAALLASIERRELWLRRLDMQTGRVSLTPGARDDEPLAFDGRVLQTLHGPRWRLLLIGAGQISHYLADMARALDYDVTVCDPRPEYAEVWKHPSAKLVGGYPDDAVIAMEPDARSAIVTLTHDAKLDDAALMEALKSPAFFVGALGSDRTSALRRERLLTLDLSHGEVARLHAPVGLPIGSRTPPEIAVSILAQMTAIRQHGAAADLDPADFPVSQAGALS